MINRVLGIILFLAGIGVAVTPRYILPVCEYHGYKEMACSFTGKAEIFVGIISMAASAGIFFSRTTDAFRWLAVTTLVSGISVIAIPHILGYCHSGAMPCNYGTVPLLRLIGGSIILASLIGLFSTFRVKKQPLLLLAFILALTVSCKKEEHQRQETSPKAINPYSTESVFDEVKRKLEKNPNDLDALFHIADLYERDSQYEDAVAAYKKIIRLKPDSGYVYFKMGTDYNRLQKFDEAVNAFKTSIKYMPKNPVAYNNLGVAYGKLGKTGEEIASLKKAIQLRPSYTTARFNLGMTYLRAGNRKGASQEYEALKKFDQGAAESLMKEIEK